MLVSEQCDAIGTQYQGMSASEAVLKVLADNSLVRLLMQKLLHSVCVDEVMLKLSTTSQTVSSRLI